MRCAATTRRQNTCEHSQRAAKVDVDEAGPLIVGQLEERHDRLDAGVVDEDVDRPELVPDALEHRLDLRATRHVGFTVIARRPADRIDAATCSA